MAHQERRRVAIIGAGCSGLASIKCCLDEGLEPVCFERREDLGGLWNYSPESRPGEGNIYESCVINTSKEMTAFSDFPVPAHFPVFMPHRYMLEYFKLYSEKFNLKKHIRFSTCVEQIEKTEDFEKTGSWSVSYRNNDDIPANGFTTEIFDAVMVCTGHHVYPHIPHIYGIEDFRGSKIHSHEYKRPEPFRNKRVLVIGMGNSAVDIAVDLSRTARKVFISTRRGAWIISRMGPLGLPADALANSRFLFSLPQNWLQKMIEHMANFRFDHTSYGVQAEHRALEAHPTINDELPYRIMTGTVQVRPDIATIAEDGVLFSDATLEDIDAIVFATGYDYQYRMLDESILKLENNSTDLYKYVFPPDLAHPTLAVVGHVQAIGSVIPISEMQARWITRTFNGKCKLPGRQEMMADISTKNKVLSQQYLESRRHKLQTFWIQYMDEIADLIGVKPNLRQLAKSDLSLALRCYFGPCLPAQYRLKGPGTWEGAAQAIRSCFDNCVAGTKRRKVWPQLRKYPNSNMWSGATSYTKDFLLIFVICLVVFFFYRLLFG